MTQKEELRYFPKDLAKATRSGNNSLCAQEPVKTLYT